MGEMGEHGERGELRHKSADTEEGVVECNPDAVATVKVFDVPERVR